MDAKKLFTKDYVLLIVTAFIGGFLMSLFVPTLPLYAERMTGSPMYSGLVTSIFTAASLLMRPIAGIACEKCRHVRIMIVGFAIMSIACISYCFTPSILAFLAVRFIHGAGYGVKTTVSGVIAAENIPKERFAEGIGIYNLYIPLTAAAGPAIAYSIVGDGYDFRQFDLLFIVGTFLGCIAIILSFLIKEKSVMSGSENKAVECTKNEHLPKTLLGFEFGVVWPAFALAMMYVGQGAVMSFVALYAIDNGIGGVGQFFMINAIAIFVARLIFAKTVKCVGYDLPAVSGFLLFGIALFAIPLTKTLLPLYGIASLLGISQGMVPMAINAIILERCSKQRAGTAMAAYTASMDIGMGLGAAVLGAILEGFGFKCIFTIAALSSFTGAIIYISKLWGNKKVVLL